MVKNEGITHGTDKSALGTYRQLHLTILPFNSNRTSTFNRFNNISSLSVHNNAKKARQYSLQTYNLKLITKLDIPFSLIETKKSTYISVKYTLLNN